MNLFSGFLGFIFVLAILYGSYSLCDTFPGKEGQKRDRFCKHPEILTTFVIGIGIFLFIYHRPKYIFR